MKKIVLGLSALSLIFAASCSKSSDNNSSPSNTFKIGSTSYTANTVQYQASTGFYQLSATANSGASMVFSFNAAPTTGTYLVTDFSNSAANAVSIQTASVNGSTVSGYETTGNDHVNATVTVTNGKVTITVPDVTAINSLSGTDSLKISANKITQP